MDLEYARNHVRPGSLGSSRRRGWRPLLVSLCNLPKPRATGLLLVDRTQQMRWLDLGRRSEDVTSGRGIARLGGLIYHVYIASETRLAVIKALTLEVLEDHPLPEVSDPHSACIHLGRLYVASTGTDEIVCYEIVDNRPVWAGAVWSASGAMRDLHHINGLADIRGDLWCSAIGPRVGTLWSEARSGYIHNITKDCRILENISHPHSLLGHGQNVYYCDSTRTRILTLEGDVVAEPAQGYVRGLAVSSGTVLVGSSVGRARSKSTGVQNPADPGEPCGTCAISGFDLVTGACLYTVDLSMFGTEVYDILPI